MAPHTYTHRERTMGTKNIAITEDAYQALKALKRSNESFTEVIERITRRSAVLELAGILPKTDVVGIEKTIKEIRKKSARRIIRTTKELS